VISRAAGIVFFETAADRRQFMGILRLNSGREIGGRPRKMQFHGPGDPVRARRDIPGPGTPVSSTSAAESLPKGRSGLGDLLFVLRFEQHGKTVNGPAAGGAPARVAN